MKKAVCLTMTMLCILLLCSCMKGESPMFLRDQNNDLADARMDQLFNAIKEQDKDALKDVFSQKALVKSGNFDVGVEYLLSFVQGEALSWNREDSPIVFDDVEDGGKTKKLVTWYAIDTDEQSYLVFLVDYPIDTIDPENAGLYSLRIITSEDENALDGSWEEWEIPGIYVPDN